MYSLSVFLSLCCFHGLGRTRAVLYAAAAFIATEKAESSITCAGAARTPWPGRGLRVNPHCFVSRLVASPTPDLLQLRIPPARKRARRPKVEAHDVVFCLIGLVGRPSRSAAALWPAKGAESDRELTGHRATLPTSSQRSWPYRPVANNSMTPARAGRGRRPRRPRLVGGRGICPVTGRAHSCGPDHGRALDVLAVGQRHAVRIHVVTPTLRILPTPHRVWPSQSPAAVVASLRRNHNCCAQRYDPDVGIAAQDGAAAQASRSRSRSGEAPPATTTVLRAFEDGCFANPWRWWSAGWLLPSDSRRTLLRQPPECWAEPCCRPPEQPVVVSVSQACLRGRRSSPTRTRCQLSRPTLHVANVHLLKSSQAEPSLSPVWARTAAAESRGRARARSGDLEIVQETHLAVADRAADIAAYIPANPARR